MSSTSSSAQLQQQRPAPEVFINHTGPGQHAAASNFAAQLYRELQRSGISAFIDFASLRPGELWQEKLEKAAGGSLVFVAVVSKPYTQREWPMLELDLALTQWDKVQQARAGQCYIIPVMFERLPSSSEVEAFWKSEKAPKQISEEQCKRWAHNISRLQDFQSFRLPAGKGAEVKLLKDIRDRIHSLIPGPVAVPRIFGYQEQLAHWSKTLLEIGTTGLWIWGLGGVGKTTLAQHLYAHLIENNPGVPAAFVGLPLEQSDAAPHVEQALKAFGVLFKARGHLCEHIQKFQEFVSRQPVLLVLDNVSNAELMDALLPQAPAIGSKVIITSRTSSFPRALPVPPYVQQHSLSGIGDLEAELKLLRLYADLDQDHKLAAELQELEDQILKACAGLPLAIVVVGGLLRQPPGAQRSDDTELRIWKGVLATIQKDQAGQSSDEKLKGVLSASLTFREGEEKTRVKKIHMFLDVVSILQGKLAGKAVDVWEAWWGPDAILAFEELQRSALVSVSSEGTLHVHDVICSLGRDMIRDPTSPYFGSRMWVEEAGHLVSFQQAGRGPSALLGLSLEGLSDSEGGLKVDYSHRTVQGRSVMDLRMCFGGRYALPLASQGMLWFEAGEAPGAPPSNVHNRRYFSKAFAEMVETLEETTARACLACVNLVEILCNAVPILARVVPTYFKARRHHNFEPQSCAPEIVVLAYNQARPVYDIINVDRFASQHLSRSLYIPSRGLGSLPKLKHITIGIGRLKGMPRRLGQFEALRYLELHHHTAAGPNLWPMSKGFPLANTQPDMALTVHGGLVHPDDCKEGWYGEAPSTASDNQSLVHVQLCRPGRQDEVGNFIKGWRLVLDIVDDTYHQHICSMTCLTLKDTNFPHIGTWLQGSSRFVTTDQSEQGITQVDFSFKEVEDTCAGEPRVILVLTSFMGYGSPGGHSYTFKCPAGKRLVGLMAVTPIGLSSGCSVISGIRFFTRTIA